MIGDFIIEVFNYIIEGVGVVLSWIIGLFPNTPFGAPKSPPNSINLGWITWLIDFPTMILHATYLTVAILAYYSIRVLARWVKVVKGG